MAIRTQTELMIRRVQFIRRKKEAATQAACARNDPQEAPKIYRNMIPANALKYDGMNEMQYYSAVRYDDSIANDNAAAPITISCF